MSYRGLRVSVCFPARNEAGNLPRAVAAVPGFVDEVLVVSNRSTDDTLEVARKLGVRALEDNRTTKGIGYGYAHLTGLQAATGDVVAVADADLTYPIDRLANVLDSVVEDELDFVSCNRYPVLSGTTIPWRLRAGVTLLNWEARILFGIKINDILSGMWVVRREVVPKLELTMGDWNLSPQIKIRARTRAGLRVGEFPVEQHQRGGLSHQRYLRTGLSHAGYLLRERFGRNPRTTPDAEARSAEALELDAVEDAQPSG